MAFPHRELGARLLSGEGLEIGALHQPFWIPGHCSIQYLDVDGVENIRASFPELANQDIAIPHYIGDIETTPVDDITERTFKFIVLNHVLEHVANPIQVMKHVWDAIDDDGCLVLSVPDKNFTFDRARSLTPYEHLLADYFLGVSTPCDDHYIDFLCHVHPEVFVSKDVFVNALQSVRRRREHVHVWDSTSFKRHLVNMMKLLGQRAVFLFESSGGDNHFEYFAVLRKLSVSTPPERVTGDHEATERKLGDARKLEGAVDGRRDSAEENQTVQAVQEHLGWKVVSGWRKIRNWLRPRIYT